MKFSTPVGSSRGPIETPTNSTWPLYLSYIFCISGISARQGGHHVPQKLTNRGLPSVVSLNGLPFVASFHSKSGALKPFFGASFGSPRLALVMTLTFMALLFGTV